MSSESGIILIAVFSITFVVLGLISFFIIMMIRSHRKIEAAQRERIRQMQLFSDKLQSTRDEEQKRIARELHDELGGSLTSIKYDLLWLEQHNNAEGEVVERFRATRGLIDSTTKLVQRICAELRPKILDSLGLGAAIEWHAQEFKKRTGIEVQLQQEAELPAIDDVTKTGVYRIVQESLTNVARHSEATNVDIKLQMLNNVLHVEIKDNGKGFDNALLNHPDSLGLLSLRERARMIGGNTEINGSPGKGTQVTLDVPLQKDATSGVGSN
jgi:signal transduction histidine kinase